MSFCSKCGVKLNDGAKFCFECGEPILNNANQRKTEYAGKINKCPSCGEILNSFEPICLSCGYELRGTKAADSVKEFEFKFLQANSIEKKIDLISIFSIPSTKDDVLEFMILAVSNINLDSYDLSDANARDVRLANAWLSKFEQAYQKSKLLFKDTSDFDELHKMYLQKKKSVSFSKKTRGFSMFFSKNKKWLGNVGGIIGMLMIPLIAFTPASWNADKKNHQLEQLTAQVEDCIKAGDLSTARMKANKIIDDSGWSSEREKKWDDIRKSLLKEIDKKQATEERISHIEDSSKGLNGKNYSDVVAKLEKNGFTNIKLVEIKDLITGLIVKDGQVDEVSIDGKTNFTTTSAFATSAEVIIKYHTFKK